MKIKRSWAIVVALVHLIGFLVAAYWYATRTDRYLAEAAQAKYIPQGQAEHLAQEMDDPRVAKAMKAHLIFISKACEPSMLYEKQMPILDQAFRDHKLVQDKVGAQALIKTKYYCRHPAAENWVADYLGSPEITEALVELIKASAGTRLDELIDEMERRKAPVSDKLVSHTVLASLGQGQGRASKALNYVHKGFPENGTALAPKATRLPPDADPRIAEGYALAFGRDSYKKMNSEDFGFYHQKLTDNPPQASDSYIKALVKAMRSTGNPRLADLARALGPVGREKLAGLANTLSAPDDKLAAGKLLKSLGQPRELYGPILKHLQGEVGRYDDLDYKAKAEAKAGQELAALGPDIKPKLISALRAEDPVLGRAATHALLRLAPLELARELNRPLGPKRAHWGRKIALAGLVTAPPSSEVNRFFGSMLGAEPHRAADALARRMKGHAFVTTLFDNLPRKQKYLPSEVSGWAQALSYTRNISKPLADRLAAELKSAGGRPERVFWVVKLLLIQELGRQGTALARPVLQKFLSDNSEYAKISQQKDPASGRVVQSWADREAFRSLAQKALADISRRNN